MGNPYGAKKVCACFGYKAVGPAGHSLSCIRRFSNTQTSSQRTLWQPI